MDGNQNWQQDDHVCLCMYIINSIASLMELQTTTHLSPLALHCYHRYNTCETVANLFLLLVSIVKSYCLVFFSLSTVLK